MINLDAIIITLGIIILIAVFVWSLYNGLIIAKTRVQEAWSGISVQLKRRADLIPNLVETVKGYAKHEKEVFENVTKARAALVGANGPQEAAKAEGMLGTALKSLFAVAEAYPKLRASENFKELQDELADTENKIAYSRQFYNTNVLEYNTRIKLFPNVLVANMLGFTAEEFFKISEDDAKEVKVKF